MSDFITLDGVIADPGGSEGTEQGGWSFRNPTPDGERLKLEELMDADVVLLTYRPLEAAGV